MKYLYKNINELQDDEYLDIYNSLDSEKQTKIDKLVRIKDKEHTLLNYYLLKKLTNKNYNEIKYTKTGKPFLKGFYISFSHSGDYSMACTSNFPVGVDLQVKSKHSSNIKIFNNKLVCKYQKYNELTLFSICECILKIEDSNFFNKQKFNLDNYRVTELNTLEDYTVVICEKK